MVCTANELLEWKDFPKGLRVLLLDEDSNSASEIKSKLEQMEYIVSVFFSEDEAISAISSKSEIFHVAIAEVNARNNDERYKFLESAKDFPTIMTSDEHCLSTMMKCIALGAVEFLIKPLSEDKLRNIWQHVVHKAFNAGGNESSQTVKEFVGSVLDIQQQNLVSQNQVPQEVKQEPEMNLNEHDHESNINDKFPAPSTPQLKQGGRIFDDGDCQDHINSSPDKDSQDQSHDGSPVKDCLDQTNDSPVHGYQDQTNGAPAKDGQDQVDDSAVIDCQDQTNGSPFNGSGGFDKEAKSVDTTCSDSVTKMEIDPPEVVTEVVIKDEGGCDDGSERLHECDSSSKPQNADKMDTTDSPGTMDKSDKLSAQNANGAKGNKKKVKVDWTAELHKKFVQAVEKLGVDQAIPSRILELMKVEGLTRHNVASHLQKYRMHRRHILPKDNSRRWPHPRDTLQRTYYPPRPVMAFPPYHANHNLSPGQVYPMWGSGPQGGQPPHFPVWGPPNYPWQPMETWHWKQPYTGVHADAWGCPVLPPPSSCPPPPTTFPQVQGAYGFHNQDHHGKIYADPNLGEEVIDKVVKEAINKPWLPLPIGLNPPSTDSVLSELSTQGISAIPPHINGHHSC